MHNYHGKDLASADWLMTHFRAKSPQRMDQIIRLPIKSGSRVLDACSGPGIFARYFMPMIGETGYLLCIDHDPINVDIAERNLFNSGFDNWAAKCDDIVSVLDIASDFDVITIFNAICYLENPEEFIKKLASRMKKGSRIIVKDFDLSFMGFSAISQINWGNLVHQATAGNETANPLPYDNFYGRKVHLLHRVSDFSGHENLVWTQHLNFPFSDASKKYIWENIRSLLDQSKSFPGTKLNRYFTSAFSIDSGWFFEDVEAVFIENEFLTVLTV